eukprot:276691_1
MSSPLLAHTVKSRIVGSLCVLLGMTLSGINEVIVKSSSNSGLLVTELVAGRFGVQLLLATLWWNIKKPTTPTILNPDDNTVIKHWYGDHPHRVNIWLRGICFATMMVMYYLGLILLPIGDFQCIYFQFPLLVVYFGALWLKEPLPAFPILIPSTILTVSGLCLVSQPTFLMRFLNTNAQYEPLNGYGILFACVGAVLTAVVILLTRVAASTHFLQLEFASSICLLLSVIPILLTVNTFLFHAEWIGSFDAQWRFDLYSDFVLIVIGSIGFCVLLFLMTGYQTAEATFVSWLEYMNIPLGFVYQALFFNDFPNKYEIIGGVLVLIGCWLPLVKQMFVYAQCRNRETAYEHVLEESNVDMVTTDVMNEDADSNMDIMIMNAMDTPT